MLDPQVIMNLLPKLRIGVDLTGRSRCLGEGLVCRAGWFVWVALCASAFRSETNEFHKLLSALVDSSRSARNEGPSSWDAVTAAYSRWLRLQVNLEIALSGVSAKVKPLDRFYSAGSALGRRMT